MVWLEVIWLDIIGLEVIELEMIRKNIGLTRNDLL